LIVVIELCRLLTPSLLQAECDLVCAKDLFLPSLFPTIFDPELIKDIVNLHCTLFSIQDACAKSWLDSGLKVDRFIGHCFGQLTALCVAGGLIPSDGTVHPSDMAKCPPKDQPTATIVSIGSNIGTAEGQVSRVFRAQ
jgi:hypothetical protein